MLQKMSSTSIIIISIFVIQALSGVLCHIDAEGTMTINRDFLKLIKKFVAFTPDNSLRTDNNFQVKSEGSLPYPYIHFARRALDSLLSNITETNSTNSSQPSLPQKYVDGIKQRGVKLLKSVNLQIIENTKSDMNMSDTKLKTVIDNYISMMDAYYNYIRAIEPKNEVDRKQLYLDMIETSNRLLYTEEKKLLDHVLNHLDNTYTQMVAKTLNQKIYQTNSRNKKSEIEYLCLEYEICKQYPAFSDYCADFITEVLKLPDTQFQQFIQMLAKVYRDNYDFIETVSKKEDREKLEKNLISISNNETKIKDLLAVIRAVIKNRFKIIESNNDAVKTKTKAMRILIDIIDKALTDEDDILSLDIDSTIHGLRRWAGGLRPHFDQMIFDVGLNWFGKMKRNIKKTAKSEMNTLLEIVASGTEKQANMAVHKKIVADGSKYANGYYEPDDKYEN